MPFAPTACFILRALCVLCGKLSKAPWIKFLLLCVPWWTLWLFFIFSVNSVLSVVDLPLSDMVLAPARGDYRFRLRGGDPEQGQEDNQAPALREGD